MTSLPEFLEAAQYGQVSLERNGAGHFETAGTLDQRSVRALIDTGAASTVCRIAFEARRGFLFRPSVHPAWMAALLGGLDEYPRHAAGGAARRS